MTYDPTVVCLVFLGAEFMLLCWYLPVLGAITIVHRSQVKCTKLFVLNYLGVSARNYTSGFNILYIPDWLLIWRQRLKCEHLFVSGWGEGFWWNYSKVYVFAALLQPFVMALTGCTVSKRDVICMQFSLVVTFNGFTVMQLPLRNLYYAVPVC